MAVYFFSWDSFFVHQTVEKQIQAFSQKYWKENIFRFWEWPIDRSEIKWMCLWWWLFAATSLIVISWIPYSTDTKPTEKEKLWLDQFSEWLAKNHQIISNFIIFTSPKPDSRTRFSKLLLASDWCVKKEISSAKWQQQLVTEYLPEQSWVAWFLLEKYKDNSRMLFNELLKVQWYQQYTKNNITQWELEQLNYTPISVDNFKLYDKILTWSSHESLEAINIARNLWDDIYQFLGWLYWYLKWLILTYYLKNDWYDSKSIASLIKYPPFTIYWLLSSVDLLSENELAKLLKWVLEIEYHIKTWSLDVSLFRSKLLFLMTTYKTQ